MYNILILGSGGREHTLAWKISQSEKCNNLFVAPGNGGTSECATNIDLDILEFKSIESFVDEQNIDFIVVGPEAPLVKGVFDHFENHSVKVIGPSQEAARLEGSKAFANDFMKEFDVPTAGYLCITKNNIEEGYTFIDNQQSNIVLKADGLAAGKGVLILSDKQEAKKELKNMLDGKFGKASETVVLEEFLDGIEFSVFVYTNGFDYVVLPEAKDYKRIGEGDTGLNTGGMGAISPVPFVNDDLMTKVKSRIIEPTLEGLQKRKLKYTGFIFFGLIKVDNDPYVIEYNCRMGDPETEVVIPRIKSDLVELFEKSDSDALGELTLDIKPETAAAVMLVSGGYPENYEKGKQINIGDCANKSLLFHAGTKLDNNNTLLTNGGRVIAVTSFANNHKDAVQKSMDCVEKIHFDKMNYRKDIGFDL